MSDTHLSAARPEGVEHFLRFVRGPCAAAARVILLGDLFDFWVSPAQVRDESLAAVLVGLRELTATGVAVGFVEGNRDFAATPELADVGVTPLPDVGVVESAERRIVFTHGDLLCTRDIRYQALRRVARTSLMRHVLRSLPERAALGLGAGARAGSKLETTRKTYGDMGLDAGAVASLLRRHHADALVCGHVHWGKRYKLDVDGERHDVVVLSAWEETGTYVSIDDGRIDFIEFA